MINKQRKFILNYYHTHILYIIYIYIYIYIYKKYYIITTVHPTDFFCDIYMAFHMSYLISVGSSLSTKAILGNKSGVKEHVHITQSQGQLPVGKNMRITDLCWSPHQDGLLASVGYSGVAIVSLILIDSCQYKNCYVVMK